MKKDLSKFWIALVIVNICVTLLSMAGVVYLLIKESRTSMDTQVPVIITPTPSVSQTPAPTYAPANSFKFTLDNFPKMDGSTSNVPLRNLIVCKLLAYQCSWDSYSDDVDAAITQRSVTITAPGVSNDTLSALSLNSTTHDAYVSLINGTTDVLFVATLPSDAEKTLALTKRVDFDVTPIAMDAFTFILNKDNPVENLNLSQILDVYTGKIINWKDLNGADTKILPYQREDNSGSQELMKSLVLKGVTPLAEPEMVIQGMLGLINKVADNQYGLGYSVYYYEQNMVRNDKLKLAAINGVVPTYETLASGLYPLTAPVYVVTRKGLDKNSSAYNLSQWIMSAEGQKVVKDSGYVPAIR